MAFCLLVIIWISLPDCNLLAWVGGERPVWRCVGDYRGALCPQRRARVMMCKGNAGKSAEWLWSRHVGAVMGPSQADGSTDYLTLWHTHWLEVWVEAGINLITTWVWWRHCFSLLHAGRLRYRAAAAHSPVISALPEGAKKLENERERGRESDCTERNFLSPVVCVVFTSESYSTHTDIETVVKCRHDVHTTVCRSINHQPFLWKKV